MNVFEALHVLKTASTVHAPITYTYACISRLIFARQRREMLSSVIKDAEAVVEDGPHVMGFYGIQHSSGEAA